MHKVILLVGGELCRHAAAGLNPQDWNCWGLRRHPTGDSQTRWIQADLGTPHSLRSLPADITHVLYAPSADKRDRDSYQTTYPLGVRNLLDALPEPERLQRFVLVGSSVVWPPSDVASASAWVDETTPTQAHNFRSEAVLQAENELFQRIGARGIALRLGGIYGPGRTRLLDGLRYGRIVAPDGPGHWSNRIHIDDAASACIHLLQLSNPDRCYIGTDGHPTDTQAFYDALADLMAVPRPEHRAMPPSGKRLSNARLARSGWAPRWPDALAGYRAILARTIHQPPAAPGQ